MNPKYEIIWTNVAENDLKKIIEYILKNYENSHIILFVIQKDLNYAESIEKDFQGKITIVCNMGLRQILAILKYCSLFVSIDSGLLHLAAGVGIKTIGLFGPNNFENIGPFKTKNKFYPIFNESLNCRPCEYNECKNKVGEHTACMESIRAEDVINTLKNIYKNAP